jgi:hypothetical protein
VLGEKGLDVWTQSNGIHRQAGTSCDELKDLGGWKTRSIFATENLLAAATRIENERAMWRRCHVALRLTKRKGPRFSPRP